MRIKKSSKVLIDTNILVRALMDENDTLADLIETSDEVHIPISIFLETIFVLEKVYKQTRSVIVDFVSTILSYDSVQTEEDYLKGTLSIYLTKSNLSIIDCFLLIYATTNSLELKTFDKSLSKLT